MEPTSPIPTYTSVLLSDGTEAKVYPMGWRHMAKFVAKLGNAVGVLYAYGQKQEPDQQLRDLAIRVLPWVVEHCVDLMGECVQINNDRTVDTLPHWDIPTLMDAWVVLNWGEESKWRPWVKTLETLLRKVTRDPSWSFSEMLSKYSSAPATVSQT